MHLPIDVALLDGMKYAELQKIAKKIGVKANMKAEKLVKVIKEHLEEQAPQQHLEEQAPQQHLEEQAPQQHLEEQAPQQQQATEQRDLQVEEPKGAPRASKKVAERKARRGKKGRKTAKEDEEVLGSDTVVLETPTATQDGLRQIDGATGHYQSCDQTPSTSRPSGGTPKATTPTVTPATSVTTKTTKSQTKSPAAKPVATRRTHTISPVKSPKANTPVVMATKRRTHTISPVIQKVATPVKIGSASKARHAAVTSGGSMRANKTSRKRPISGGQDAQPSKSKRVKREETDVEQKLHESVSPGTKEVLESLHNGLSDAQLKASINEAVARRVQEKGTDVSSSKTLTIGGTNIPRFTALAKGLSVTKPVVTPGTKPVVTPGHKDWARIHQRTFEKMESIDVYLKKRDERAQSVSAIKVKEMTQRMRTALDSLKKLKTSPHSQTDKGARIVKPVVGGRPKVKVKSLFQSPAPAPAFVPKVTSVTKMNLQFASNPSCKTKTPLPSLASSAKENLMSPKTLDAKRKSVVAATRQKAATTPFVFRGHLNQSTTDSKVKQFDLQESLARKITWKPHRGKLQPFVAPDAYKVPPKEVKVQSRADRRKKAQKHQAGSRLNAQLSRRGITIN